MRKVLIAPRTSFIISLYLGDFFDCVLMLFSDDESKDFRVVIAVEAVVNYKIRRKIMSW